jgi:Ser/Thr protein kinase RdoA (MazF antagonist)
MHALPLTQKQLAHAFSLRLAAAMRAQGWPVKAMVLTEHFNRMHPGEPVTLYSARSWLRGEYMPRPQRLISLALCLNVSPHQLMYGQFYQTLMASEPAPPWVLSEREHRLMQCLRRLAPQDFGRVEQLAWRSLAQEQSPPKGPFKSG